MHVLVLVILQRLVPAARGGGGGIVHMLIVSGNKQGQHGKAMHDEYASTSIGGCFKGIDFKTR